MKSIILGTAMGALLLGVLPASAEVVVRERDNGVVVRHDRGHHYGWRNHRAECQTVRVRTRLPNGDVIVKTRSSC
ncbi:MAG: hypothetical protein WA322_16965 [Pseudolabrys sp.]